VIADADTGYGGLLNVGRTVRDYERAGAAAIQIEDQTFPKKCGHYANKSVVPIEEMLARVRAALDARVDPDLLIIGRTDAVATSGFEIALERANLMVAEGVDVVFVEAPTDTAQLARIPSEVSAPVLVNIVERGRTPNIPVDQLERWGYRIVIFPNMITRTIVRAAQGALEGLRRDGTSTVDLERMVDFDELSDLVGLPESTRLEDRLTDPSGPPPT
jgi:methylisocitrate lyase